MSGTVSYLFYAIDKPLTAAQRARVATLSRRVQLTARSAEFSYQVEGYDIPGGYEPLMAKYYDAMVRQDYGLWTLGMAFPYAAALHQALEPFTHDAGDGVGVFLEKLGDSAGRSTTHKAARPKRLLAEFSGFLDYDAADALSGLPELPRESASEGDEDEDEDDWDDEWEYRSGDSDYDEGDTLEATLARLAYRIRTDTLSGDYRAFYLMWKKFAPARERKTALPEPPRLKRLPAHLRSLTKLLRSEP